MKKQNIRPTATQNQAPVKKRLQYAAPKATFVPRDPEGRLLASGSESSMKCM